jgi:methyltransferase family protein
MRISRRHYADTLLVRVVRPGTRAYALLRAAINPLRHFADGVEGYLYGTRLRVPAAGHPPGDSGKLETYFDGHTSGPGIWKWRHYFPIYERHLSPFVGRPVRVVEIGVFSGGSLGMWRSYFGEQAEIIGVDVEPACRSYEGPGVRIFIGDQGDRRFWREFIDKVGDVDVVIDDGGHHPRQQIATLEALLPHMRPGGVYLCEDVCGASNPFLGYVHGLASHLNKVGHQSGEAHATSPFQRAVASVHLYPFVVVVERSQQQVEAFLSQKRGTEWQPFGAAWSAFRDIPSAHGNARNAMSSPKP